jgi:hypothetical protein
MRIGASAVSLDVAVAGGADLAHTKEEVDRQNDLPLSSRFPLAQLEIARIYARKSASAKARAQYRQFFDLWKGADSDAPLLVAAQREAAQLP